jgi:hypothetical protein
VVAVAVATPLAVVPPERGKRTGLDATHSVMVRDRIGLTSRLVRRV